MQWRAEARRIQQLGQTRCVAVEIRPEQQLYPPDGAVPLSLVEQLVHEIAQLPLVAEEPLQSARQPALAVGEVLAQDMVQCRGRLLVCGFRLAQEALKLG